MEGVFYDQQQKRLHAYQSTQNIRPTIFDYGPTKETTVAVHVAFSEVMK